ncbi:MAG: PBSX family phage terminase large subunit [Clostridia bacterium]|nr:PBSX family phage terminase large subunit [Clostridia bacterium]
MDALRTSLRGLIAPPFYGVHRCIRAGEYAEIWLKGGRGSAKSSFASVEIVLGMLRNPEASAIIYRKVANTLRESVYSQMLWAIDALGAGMLFQRKLSPMELIYRPTGQKIVFRGADDPGKSKSMKLKSGYFGFLWFEELTEFAGPDDITTIKASVIRGGGKAVTFYSYNPPVSARNWVNEEALKTVAGRLVHHSDYRGVPREWLGDAFIAEAEKLRDANERAYRHTYLGEVTGTGGQVFDNLVLRTITDEEINSFGQCYNGLDFGFATDPDALVRWGYDAKLQRAVMLGEFYGSRTPLDALAAHVKRMCRREVVRCDSADPRMIAELRNREVNAVAARKGPGSVEHGIRWLQDLREIVVDPARCPNAARELSTYEYQRDRHGNFLAEFPDKDNHVGDATRYSLEPVIAMRKLQTMDKRLLF